MDTNHGWVKVIVGKSSVQDDVIQRAQLCRLLALESFQTGVYSVKQEMSPCWAFIQIEQHEGEEITEFHFWLNYIFNEWRNVHKPYWIIALNLYYVWNNKVVLLILSILLSTNTPSTNKIVKNIINIIQMEQIIQLIITCVYIQISCM